MFDRPSAPQPAVFPHPGPRLASDFPNRAEELEIRMLTIQGKGRSSLARWDLHRDSRDDVGIPPAALSTNSQAPRKNCSGPQTAEVGQRGDGRGITLSDVAELPALTRFTGAAARSSCPIGQKHRSGTVNGAESGSKYALPRNWSRLRVNARAGIFRGIGKNCVVAPTPSG